MLDNFTLDKLNLTADCRRTANVAVAFSNCAPNGSLLCDDFILSLWELLNATVTDMRPYPMQQLIAWCEAEAPNLSNVFRAAAAISVGCKAEVCTSTTIQVNPDMAGIGVCWNALRISLLLVSLYVYSSY